MKDSIEFGIGFVTGRPNVCKIINNYYKEILNQIENKKNVKITVYILYDIKYQLTKRTDFYNILPEVYKKIKIEYITPEKIEKEKNKLIKENKLTQYQADLFLGYGHARSRNTLMYFALKKHTDYLLFWDDDEYPVAVKKDDNQLNWIKQNNISKHIENMENADVTIGYHCGYISPIPYIKLKNKQEEAFKQYIEAISNEIITWESIKQKMINENGVTYADENVLKSEAYELKNVGKDTWVAGSTLCLNLNNIEKIPAFYNPEGARGEDTFFSTKLLNARVIKVPVYHFHDGFLKYQNIMKNKYPKKLDKIEIENFDIEKRFMQASEGWIKYKPLLMYITDKENYNKKILEVYKNLEKSIPKIKKIFKKSNIEKLLKILEEYDKNVEKDYQEYIEINNIWDVLKTTYESRN